MSDPTRASPAPSISRPWQSRVTLAAVVILIAAVTTGLLLWITRSGIGLGRDSRAYLRLTRIIRNSGVPGWIDSATGAITVETHYPPGYSMLLAKLADALDGSAPEAARSINAAAIALSIGLVAALAAGATHRPSRAVLAAVLLALAAGTWQTHTFLLSEATFGTLLLATFVATAIHLRRGTWVWLFVAAVCAGASVIVRYAGVALVLASVVAIALAPRPNGQWRRRLFSAGIFSAIASIPMAIWVGWYSRQAGSAAAARDAGFHPPGWDQFATALASMAEWVGAAPRMGTFGMIVGGVVFIATVVLAMYAWKACRKCEPTSNGGTSGIALPFAYLIVYPIFLLVSVSFFDAATPFDQRILYPMHVAAIVLFAVLMPTARWRARGLIGALIALQLFTQGMYLKDVRELHLGYNGMRWQREPVIQFIRGLPRGVTIVTDNVEVIELAAERNSIQLPRVDGLPDPGDRVAHRQAMAQLREKVPDGAYLILINRNRGSRRYTPLSRLEKAFQLKPVMECPTGPVFLIERPELRPTTKPSALNSR